MIPLAHAASRPCACLMLAACFDRHAARHGWRDGQRATGADVVYDMAISAFAGVRADVA